MEVYKAIHTRQSIGQVKPDPVSRDLIEKILSAAVQAPNHYKVRPWRFVVMTGAARQAFFVKSCPTFMRHDRITVAHDLRHDFRLAEE